MDDKQGSSKTVFNKAKSRRCGANTKTVQDTSTGTTKAEKQAIYYSGLHIAKHLAKRFAAHYKLPFHEVLDEAMSILGSKAADWDSHFKPGKSLPTTWLYFCINKELLTLITRKNTKTVPFSAIDMESYDEPQARRCRRSFMSDLGDDALTLVQIVTNAPRELENVLTTRAKVSARSELRAYMTQRLGWSYNKLHKAWMEVAECLQ